MTLKKFIALVFIFQLIVETIFAQAKSAKKELPTTRILFVFDCSLSMSKRWENSTNMDISKRVLNQAIDSLSHLDKVEVALRMYGHQSSVQPNRNCKDTKLEVPFYRGNVAALKDKVKQAQPRGTTPIAYTLEQCGADFPNDPNARNIIILITDGIEECDGDPCAVSAALQSKGIVLKPFVIGVGLDESFKKTFECVGKFFDAKNEKSFNMAMGVIISQALNTTTAQVNLLDSYTKPTETAVNMTFYDSRTGVMKYNYIHTINNRGNPDTLPLDPLSTYKMVVHTIPQIEKDSIELTPGKHTIIAIDAPQGYLTLKANGTNEYKDLKYIIRKKGDMNTLLVSDADKLEKLLVGKYDVEILSLPRIYLNEVVVSQSKTTTMQIPQPGIANVVIQNLGYGQIFLNEKNKLKLIYNIGENSIKETLVLQPGSYTAVFRPKNSKESIYTITREFKVESGTAIQVKLF